jgi:hypothetical protein
MRLSEQSLELVRIFKEASKLYIYFSPKQASLKILKTIRTCAVSIDIFIWQPNPFKFNLQRLVLKCF